MSRGLAVMIRASICLFILTVSVLCTSKAAAAYVNYNSILLGERAAGLGGAYTALAADPSATPYYNPATSILQEGSSFSGSVSIFNKYETAIGQSNDFQGAPARINKGFFHGVPASSGTILNFKTYAIGLSIITPDYDTFSGQVQSPDGTVSLLNYVDQSLWVGLTYSKRLTPVDAYGFSLYYTSRNFNRSVNDKVMTGGGTGEIVTSEEKILTSNSLILILGYHHQFIPNWSVGVSYRPPSLRVSGEGSYYRSTTQTNPFLETTINQGSIRATSQTPQRLAIGVAREIAQDNTISVDLQMYAPLDYKDFPDFDTGTDDLHYKFTTNLAMGYEKYVRNWLSLRGGLFTNLTSTRTIDSSSPYRQLDHINLYGVSANLNIRMHEQTSFTFGGYYSGGTGLSTELVGGSVKTIAKSQQIFTMLVGTGFHF